MLYFVLAYYFNVNYLGCGESCCVFLLSITRNFTVFVRMT